jgi:hypothetical protein
VPAASGAPANGAGGVILDARPWFPCTAGSRALPPIGLLVAVTICAECAVQRAGTVSGSATSQDLSTPPNAIYHAAPGTVGMRPAFQLSRELFSKRRHS